MQQRGRVGADAEERDMREGELAGPAEQEVEPERQHRVHHQDVAEEQEVLRQQVGQHEAGDQQDRERRQAREGRRAVHVTPSWR